MNIRDVPEVENSIKQAMNNHLKINKEFYSRPLDKHKVSHILINIAYLKL